MVWKVELTASSGALLYCERFRHEINNSLTDAERNATATENYHAKVSELEVGRYLGMKWSVLEPLLNGAAKFDVVCPFGRKGDIKGSLSKNGNTLFWPRGKWEDFEAREFDWLGFCNTSRLPIIEFRGYVSKNEFRAHHLMAGEGHWLKPRTRYWPEDRPLLHPEGLLRAPERHGVPQFRNDHLCFCGQYGCHALGFGPISELEWRCGEHAQ